MRRPFGPLALSLTLWGASACNLLADKVPCQRDENCSVAERCRDGACVARSPVSRDDAGEASATDGGEDAGDDVGSADAGSGSCHGQFLVTTGPLGVTAGTPARVSFDHAALVAAGFAADGSDFALRHEGEDVPRVLDPASSWASATTTLWFTLIAPLAAQDTSAPYAIEQRAGESARYTAGDVFPFADTFDRPDSDTVSEPWSAPYGGVGIRSNGLAILTGDNADNRPFVDLALPQLQDPFELIVGFHFARAGDESIYRVHLQLGDSASMVEPLAQPEHFARDGSSVSLVWSGASEGLAAEETLAADTPSGYTPLGVVSGPTRIAIRITPGNESYDVALDEGAPFSGLTAHDPATGYDRLRLVLYQVGNLITPRRLEYVLVRTLSSDEPVVSTVAPAGCR